MTVRTPPSRAHAPLSPFVDGRLAWPRSDVLTAWDAETAGIGCSSEGRSGESLGAAAPAEGAPGFSMTEAPTMGGEQFREPRTRIRGTHQGSPWRFPEV